MVSGGAGATIVVLIALIQSHCIEYLFATVALAGMLQMIVGIFKLGNLSGLFHNRSCMDSEWFGRHYFYGTDRTV
jgi:MFS superfamily sulfate permease-like transporter